MAKEKWYKQYYKFVGSNENDFYYLYTHITPEINLVLANSTPLVQQAQLKIGKYINDNNFIVINGDIYCDFDLSDMIKTHNTVATIGTYKIL